jgi:hypothetical protein
VGQSSSQHDKCQVGNMHTYSLDLVHFSIHSSFHHHSLTHSVVLVPSILYPVPVPVPYMYTIPVLYLVSLGVGLKKRVVRPVGY